MRERRRRRRLPPKAVLLVIVVASGGQSCRNHGEGRGISLPRVVHRAAFVATGCAAAPRRAADSAYQAQERPPAATPCVRHRKASVGMRQQRPWCLPVSASGAAPAAATSEQDPPEHANGNDKDSGGQAETDEDLWSSVEWAGDGDGMSGSGNEAMVGSQEFIGLVKAQFDLLSTVLDASRVVLFVRRESTETGGTRGSHMKLSKPPHCYCCCHCCCCRYRCYGISVHFKCTLRRPTCTQAEVSKLKRVLMCRSCSHGATQNPGCLVVLPSTCCLCSDVLVSSWVPGPQPNPMFCMPLIVEDFPRVPYSAIRPPANIRP